MAATRVCPLAVMAVLLTLAFSKCSAGEHFRHHVVGDDRGWDPTSDVGSWAAARIFVVGDSLWFTYSASQEKIVELGSWDEYEACDLSNPIRMYTDGLSKVSLDGEGTRYFASGNSDSCKKGLKIPVDVKPKSATATEPLFISRPEESAVASAPSSPSGAGRVFGGTAGLGVLLGGLLFLWV
ncbi:hypothetical protein V2J09_012282 [Rumex salicifolius]